MTSDYEQLLSAEALKFLHPNLVIKLKQIIEDNMRMSEELHYLKEDIKIRWMENVELQQRMSSLQAELQEEKEQRRKLEGKLMKVRVEMEKKRGVEETILKIVDRDYDPQDRRGDDSNNDNDLNDNYRHEPSLEKVGGISGRSIKLEEERGERDEDGHCLMAHDLDDGEPVKLLQGYSLAVSTTSSKSSVDENMDSKDIELGPVTVSRICYDDHNNMRGDGKGPKQNHGKLRKSGPGRPRIRPDPTTVDHYEIEFSSPPKCSCGREYQLRGRLLNHIQDVPNRNRKRGSLRSNCGSAN